MVAIAVAEEAKREGLNRREFDDAKTLIEEHKRVAAYKQLTCKRAVRFRTASLCSRYYVYGTTGVSRLMSCKVKSFFTNLMHAFLNARSVLLVPAAFSFTIYFWL